jgi:putative ABC transport system ATP-binding protein
MRYIREHMPVLQAIGLTKTYGAGENRVDALRDVSIAFERGEFTAIVGPSGSGKSTLLHMLGGLDRPTSGTVVAEDRDLSLLSEEERAIFRRRTVGFIFQFYNLVPVLTAEENIALPALLDNRRLERRFLDALLGELGLSERRRHMPSELSGGQQQRVSIGRALACRPSIVLADEPTGNLDRKTGREIIEMLKLSARRHRQTLIVITHDPEIASEADRIVSIEDGRIAPPRARGES